MAFDFVAARRALLELAAQFDHRDINTVSPFDGLAHDRAPRGLVLRGDAAAASGRTSVPRPSGKVPPAARSTSPTRRRDEGRRRSRRFPGGRGARAGWDGRGGAGLRLLADTGGDRDAPCRAGRAHAAFSGLRDAHHRNHPEVRASFRQRAAALPPSRRRAGLGPADVRHADSGRLARRPDLHVSRAPLPVGARRSARERHLPAHRRPLRPRRRALPRSRPTPSGWPSSSTRSRP